MATPRVAHARTTNGSSMTSPTPAPRARATSSVRGDLGRSMVALDQGWAMGQEMLAGILIVSGLGYLLDRALGTTPWLFAIGALAGFACGLTLVYGRAQRMDAADAADAAARDAALAAAREARRGVADVG